jgi:anti-sigma regulatory factor (Ser/Thr protein kinase)
MPGELMHLKLHCDDRAPSLAREAVAEASEIGRLAEDATLVASELVTNAVRHSECSDRDFLTVCVTRNGCLRISVIDPGRSEHGAQIADRPMHLGGMGLKVVSALASKWGSRRRREGYEVWADFEVAV